MSTPVARAVEAAAELYDLGRPTGAAVPAARGQQGVLWRLETESGRFAVKQLLVPTTEQEVALDVAVQGEMVRRGVPAPRPLRTREGSILTRVGDVLLRASTWADLAEPTPDLDPERLGRLLATLHRDPLPARTPVDPWYTDPVPEPRWHALAEDLAAAGAPFAREFADAVPHHLAMQELFRPPADPQLCHRDLWATNLRHTRDGDLCVIDWDNCGPAGAVQELAVALFEFCGDDPARATALVRAYRAHGGPRGPGEPADFTMALAQFGHFAEMAAERWLATTDGGARERAEAWFREGIERPLDLPGIEALLAAVRRA